MDDRPFGGGPGMVLHVEPVVECVEAVRAECPDPGRVVMLSPQGRRLDQAVVEELAGERRLLLLCGRYEGFDERIKHILQPDEISIGDFVLNGGEVAAMVVIDAVIRLVPGVLGDERSSGEDSFSGPERMLEFSQYTRPREYRGLEVPEDPAERRPWPHRPVASRRAAARTRERRARPADEPCQTKPTADILRRPVEPGTPAKRNKPRTR